MGKRRGGAQRQRVCSRLETADRASLGAADVGVSRERWYRYAIIIECNIMVMCVCCEEAAHWCTHPDLDSMSHEWSTEEGRGETATSLVSPSGTTCLSKKRGSGRARALPSEAGDIHVMQEQCDALSRVRPRQVHHAQSQNELCETSTDTLQM